MALTYEVDNRLKSIAPVLDEHAEWFGHVMRRMIYPENYPGAGPLSLPMSFKRWAAEAEKDDFIEKITLAGLRRIHDDLDRAAAVLVTSSESKPPLKSFDNFANLYDDFVIQMRRLEKDSAQADSGIDALTGLRSKKAMDKDLERELERRSRRGKPFCLVIARIDNFDAVRACMDEEQVRATLDKAAGMMKRCIRSFDDAYRSGEAEFVMALKHSDTSGGTIAINRLRHFLAEDPIIFKKEDQTFAVTMSYCAAEPMPGDVIETLLQNMRLDLSQYNEGGDTALEYFEQSPLERFISKMDDDFPDPEETGQPNDR
jgi:diguanylate cyclase